MFVSDLFGDQVFDDRAMSEALPKEIFKKFKKCCIDDTPLPLEVANVIANAMKDWAISKGVTHYTHWFQPMTGITAEKHDSFITPAKNGSVLMELSGKELIKGESDASSFPNGGLRSTFEARGYTAWDPTSFAFIKDGILCIPTAFCSYNGDSLDKKTPLLRSMEAINKQGLRLIKLFGKKANKIEVSVGPEQEYFLIDTDVYKKRKDLIFTGRTLFGAKPPKGQELNDHYFGTIKPRVAKYMKELDEELWKVGILAKTKHNEAAPSQHEFAPIFTSCNVAVDQNQITMEIMKKVAAKYNMTCILHERPFNCVNGSGKHNNWSLSTDTGIRFLDPGKSPEDNALFLLVICAMISAVDKHQDLLRISVASASNDLRLGANEAPPAIISMYLGDELTSILQAIADGKSYSKRADSEVKIGVNVMPKFAMDSSDRNRTSPLAFTGNKFEFRMPGSAMSISSANTVLNTIVADEFDIISTELEKAEDLDKEILNIIKNTMKNHSRIIFNGNSYSEEWKEEAKKRGLLNLPTTVDALKYLDTEKNKELFKRQLIFNETELSSRSDIYIENYCMIKHIEAMTMSNLAALDIIPSVIRYKNRLVECAERCAAVGIKSSYEVDLANKLEELIQETDRKIKTLDASTNKAFNKGNNFDGGEVYKNEVIPAMEDLRITIDELESNTAKAYWPIPRYEDLLFSIE